MLSSLNDTTQHVMWFNMYLAIWRECEHYSKYEHQVWSLLLFMTLSPECFLIGSASAKMVSDQQTVEVNLLSLSTNYSSHPSFLGPLLNIVIAIYSQQSMSVIINKSMWLEDHTISCGSVRNKLKVAHPVSWKDWVVHSSEDLHLCSAEESKLHRVCTTGENNCKTVIAHPFSFGTFCNALSISSRSLTWLTASKLWGSLDSQLGFN